MFSVLRTRRILPKINGKIIYCEDCRFAEKTKTTDPEYARSGVYSDTLLCGKQRYSLGAMFHLVHKRKGYRMMCSWQRRHPLLKLAVPFGRKRCGWSGQWFELNIDKEN